MKAGDLDAAKATKNRLGGTVNDIVLAVVTGVVRSFLQARHVPLDRVEIRLSMPVNTRPEADRGKLGNRIGVVTIPCRLQRPRREEGCGGSSK